MSTAYLSKTLEQKENASGKEFGRKHLWTRDEVYRAMAAGVFGGEPTDRLKMELLEGKLYEIMPQNPPHTEAIENSVEILREVFGTGYYIREEKPIRVNEATEPEPDVAVVIGKRHDYNGIHPQAKSLHLLLEVSDTTLRIDKGKKARIYANANIPDYWILILKTRTLEIRRDPAPSQKNVRLWEYRDIKVYQETDSVTPLHAPDAIIKVADLLPAIKNTPTEG